MRVGVAARHATSGRAIAPMIACRATARAAVGTSAPTGPPPGAGTTTRPAAQAAAHARPYAMTIAALAHPPVVAGAARRPAMTTTVPRVRAPRAMPMMGAATALIAPCAAPA